MPEKILVIRTRPETEASEIAERLQQIASEAGERVAVQICFELSTAKSILQLNDAAILCQIYTSPERFLSRAIQYDHDLTPALEIWKDEASDMLALHRQNRDRSLLFEAAHFCRYSDVGLARLGFSTGSMILQSTLEHLFMSAPLPRLLAEAHIQSRQVIMDLRDELDASTQILSNDPHIVPPLSAELALQHYRAQALLLEEMENELETAKRHCQMALASLKASKAESASKEGSLCDLKAEVESLRAERERLGAEVSERDTRLRVRVEEIERLRADLNTTENSLLSSRQEIRRISADRDRGLEKLEVKIAELAQTSTEKHNQVQELEKEISRIMMSRSIRLTAPLRQLRALFSRRNND